MNRKNIEQLVLLVVIALVIESTISAGIAIYVEQLMSSENIREIRESMLFIFLKYYKVHSNFIIGAFIGYWLTTVTSSKKFLWFMLGLMASWWGLLVYFLYLYSAKEIKNT